MLIKLLQLFFPKETIKTVPPEEWGSIYARARLESARLNIVTELGTTFTLAGEQVKRIASWEPVSARHPYGRQFDFVPRAHHAFGANSTSRVNDHTTAFARRVLAIVFEHPLQDAEIDGGLLDRIRDEERPGVLAWAMEGAERLARRGIYLLPPGHAEAVLRMQFGDDPVELFVRLRVEAAPGDAEGTTTEVLRAALKAFAEARRVDTEGWTDVTHMRRLAERMKELYKAGRAMRDGRPFYRYVHLRPDRA
jgi:phage/plasmid-associated DNA primase